jgi:putative transposase
MARLPRVVAVDVAHHVTQRGNARQAIFVSDQDRVAYLELLRQYADLYHLSLLGYCLMSNHVHLIVVPRNPTALSETLKNTHGRYASYWNARRSSSGHVWQGRFYSCPLDDSHLWASLRYVELNPVRAGIVSAPGEWPWSSAVAHCSRHAAQGILDMERWQKRWTVAGWIEYLAAGESQSDASALRRCTHAGRPLGTSDFITALEQLTARRLAPQKGGRPRKPVGDARQSGLSFVA